MKKRLTALLLVVVLVASMTPLAFAASVDDYPAGVNVMIRSEKPHTYLDVKSSSYTWGLSARIWSYITADGKVTGPAYCTNHGSGYPNGYIAVNTTPYTANPKMAGAFSSGYPLVPLTTFTALHPETSGLTQDEYGYATQVAIWATLGQVAVEGTSYTSGAETVFRPTDAAKLRVYHALLAILDGADNGMASIGMRIRESAGSSSDTVDLGTDTSLSQAASTGSNGIMSETIGGKQYYTREFVLTCTAMPDSGSVTLLVSGAPSGTVLANAANQILSNGTVNLSASGTGYSGVFKICVPADAAEADAAGSVTVQAAANIASCTFYKVENSHAYEQDFIIADPNSGTSSAAGYLKWGESGDITPDVGAIRLLKTGENGEALADTEFDIDGSGGYHASGITGSDGSITWTDLPVGQSYTITETAAPDGYQLAEPISVSARPGQTVYVTVTDSSEKTFRIHKQDRQSGFSLEGAVFQFKQIDGDFTTEGRTGADGLIVFTPKGLPYGAYRVSELSAPQGYEKDDAVKTVNWDGKADVDLYFTNVRKPGFKILKVDSNTNVPLSGAYFDIYKDGELIDSVRTNEQGIATVSGVSEGYYECVERIAPYGYVLDESRHGIHINPFDPAASDDPILRVTNKHMPALRIVKYDAQTLQPLSDVTFAVYKDTELLGQYTTDRRGEIYLYDLEPGTYTAQEISAPDSHVVNYTPQSIELEAGATQTYNLVFFNALKPGIHLRKVDAQTLQPLVNAKFRITQVGGTFSQEYTTDADGCIDLTGLDPGSYTVVELEAPEHYLIDDAQRIIRIEGGDNAEFIFTDTHKPALRLVKMDSLTGERLPGATFRIARIADGTHYLDRVTDINGEINISDMEPGVYSVQELEAPNNYVLDRTEYHVELFPGQTSQIVVSNDVKPDLRIVKRDAETGKYLQGAVFQVKKADGATLTVEETNDRGEIILKNIEPGVYEVIEKTPPIGYLPARQPSQMITLRPNKLGTVIFENYTKPTLTVNKVNSITGDPIQGTKFHIWYGSNNTEVGELHDMGYFYTDENGQIMIGKLKSGWYKITEVEPSPGFSIKDPDTQTVFIQGGESKTVTFENIPLSALVVYKYDSVTGKAIEGAVFRLRDLSETSGAEGTVIGTYRTGANGSFTVTGLKAGTYIVEEIATDHDHVIDTPPQTVHLTGKAQDVVQLFFGNAPKGSLLVKKVSTGDDKAPLADVEFLVTKSDGTLVGDANGKFVTDSTGSFLVEGIDPGTTLVVKETRAKAGYLLDDAPQTAMIRAGQTVSLEFRNQPLGSLVIEKLGRNGETTGPLEGVKFEIKYANGKYVDTSGGKQSSNGIYYTDAKGQIIIPGITGTVVVTELESIPGYAIDPNTRSQTVTINPDDTQTLRFYNNAIGGVEIIKVSAADRSVRIPGAVFEIRKINDALVKTITTDKNGRAFLALEDGAYYGVETYVPGAYVLDSTPFSFEVKGGAIVSETITNEPVSGIIIHKVSSTTGNGIYGAKFVLYDSNRNPIGEYTSDQNGYVYIHDLVTDAARMFYLRELEAAPGYVLDTQYKSVYLSAGSTKIIEWKNTPVTGQIQVYKYAAENNPITGTAAGTPLRGAIYEICDARSGRVVEYITTDARGVAASSAIPLGRYTVREVTAPAYWQLDKTVFDATLEYSGQIIMLAAYDKTAELGVVMTKRSNAEVLAGTQMRYDITVANSSNVPLDSFYWHDKLPYDVTRAFSLTTGTYSARLNYRVLYKTNYTAGYQVLASNLLSTNNYSFALSAIPLQYGEVITDVYFDFGTVPVGFQSVISPTVTVQVSGDAVNGYLVVNRGDAGGKYCGTWETAQASWITMVRKLWQPITITLPKTGY